jgi:CRP-like cAMP-binding protein
MIPIRPPDDGISRNRPMLSNNEKLLQSDMFRGLSDDAARRLVSLGRRRICVSGEEILAQGEPGVHVVYVASGVVRLTRTESSGRDADIRVCEPGDFIAEYVISLGGSYAHDACAGALSELVFFEAAALRVLADECPQFQRNLLKISARVCTPQFSAWRISSCIIARTRLSRRRSTCRTRSRFWPESSGLDRRPCPGRLRPSRDAAWT